MINNGKSFENETKEFIQKLFSELGYAIQEIRKQWSGVQYGFDVIVIFKDNNTEQNIFFECKDYSNKLNWQEFQDKIIQLNASAYMPTAFVGLSPHCDVSNVNHNSIANLKKIVNFPFEIWSPDHDIKKYFGLYPETYKKIYGQEIDFSIDRDAILQSIKNKITVWIQRYNDNHQRTIGDSQLAISSLITFSKGRFANIKWSKAFASYFNTVDLERIKSHEVITKVFSKTSPKDYGGILKIIKSDLYPNLEKHDLDELKRIFEMFGFNYDSL